MFVHRLVSYSQKRLLALPVGGLLFRRCRSAAVTSLSSSSSHGNSVHLYRLGAARPYSSSSSSPKKPFLEALEEEEEDKEKEKGKDKKSRSPQTASSPKTLSPPSQEQQVAIDTLLHTKNNLIVNACAGSGKTTTILHLAVASPETTFLVLVYNNRLMKEMQARIESLGLTNITTLTYHGLGHRCYTSECANDQGLKRVVEDDMPVRAGMKLPPFSFLVMDEQQDMTPILKRFVDKVIRDRGGSELRVGVFGDTRQELYGFNNADSRHLTLADRPEVFGYVNNHGWTRVSLTTSMRITKPQADFINQQLLRGSNTTLRATRTKNQQGDPYPRPRYVVCDPRKDLLDEVLRLLYMPGTAPDDIIVLVPSVRERGLVIELANNIALKDIPVFRSDSDFQDINQKIAKGKILICTNHQAKGIERKAAVVLHFDQGFHDKYDRVMTLPTAVSNLQYVAVTRAYEHLVLIHNYKNPPLPFVDMDTVDQTCDLVKTRQLVAPPSTSQQVTPRTFKRNVTDLCRNLPESLISECLERLDFRMLSEPKFGVKPPPTEVPDRYGGFEGVSHISGIAASSLFWHNRRPRWAGTMRPANAMLMLLRNLPPHVEMHPIERLQPRYYDKLESIVDEYDSGVLTTDAALLAANTAMSIEHGDITKLVSIPIDGYTWLTEEQRHDIIYTLNTLPPPAKLSGTGLRNEHRMRVHFPDITSGGGPTNPIVSKGVCVFGAMDYCRLGGGDGKDKVVWETKYTDSLQPVHLIQLALYMLLLNSGKGDGCSGFLVSSRTGQTVLVLPKTPTSLSEILQLLVNASS